MVGFALVTAVLIRRKVMTLKTYRTGFHIALVSLGLCLMSPGTTSAAEPASSQSVNSGRISMTKINVSDLDRSLAFYTKILGFKEETGGRIELPAMTEVLLTSSGRTSQHTLILVFQKNRHEPLVLGNAFNALVFVLPDLRGTVKKIADAGYQISPVTDTKSRWTFASITAVATGKDPDGFPLELVQYIK